jgi:hypothetical protein
MNEAIRALISKHAEITIEVQQDCESVRGNAMASGDEQADRECENEIIERVNSGDVWAWASVRVIAEFGGERGDNYLGCCSYADENDFRQPGGYFDAMKSEAIDVLLARLEGTPRVFVSNIPKYEFLCADCIPAELDLALDETQVWQELTHGWTDSCVCGKCKLSIPVYVDADESETV